DGLAYVLSPPAPSNRRGFLRDIRMQSRLLRQRELIPPRGIQPGNHADLIRQRRRNAHGFCAQLQRTTTRSDGLARAPCHRRISDVPVFYLSNTGVVPLDCLPGDVATGISYELRNPCRERAQIRAPT